MRPPRPAPHLPLLAALLAALSLGTGFARAPSDGTAAAAPNGGSIMAGLAPGFVPAHCGTRPPPAELLALADWPLDPGGTCVGDDGAAPVVEAVIRPISSLVAVIELEWRPVRPLADVHRDHDLPPYGDLDTPAPAAGTTLTATDFGDFAASPEADLLPPQRLPAATPSAPPRVQRPLQLAEAPVASAEALDELRGGFETPSGMRVSFGIERAVYINGVLNSVTSVNIADLGELTGRGIDPATLAQGATVAIIQNGPGNVVSAQLNPSALATVIQNSLDNQQIRAVTTINATVNTMEMLRSHHLNQALRDTMTQSLMR